MNVSCPKCADRIPGRSGEGSRQAGVRARCSFCCAPCSSSARPSASRRAGARRRRPRPAPRRLGGARRAAAPRRPPLPQPVVAAGAGAAAARPAVTPPAGAGSVRLPPQRLRRAAAPPPPAVAPSRPGRRRPSRRPATGRRRRRRPLRPPLPVPPRAAPPAATGGRHPGAAPKRRPIPFLSPGSRRRKARRLARALISDIVVYHPAKRADGIRDGTLKLLFEEEIRKSWEEYIDQVGLEMADVDVVLHRRAERDPGGRPAGIFPSASYGTRLPGPPRAGPSFCVQQPSTDFSGWPSATRPLAVR